MKRSASSLFACLLFGVLSLGCGGKPLTSQGPAVPGPVIEDVLSVLSAPQTAPQAAVIVGLTPAPVQLVAFDPIAGKTLWKKPVAPRFAPILAGDLVVVQTTEGRLMAYALTDGRQVLDVALVGDLVGASGSAASLVVSVAMGQGKTPRSLVMGYAHGKQIWTRELPYEAGVPALVDKLAIVPWAGQRVSVLDAVTGNERLRFDTPTMVTHALVDNGRLYLGANELYRVGPGLDADPKAKGLVYAPLRRSLPSAPSLLRNGLLPAPKPDEAFHRVRLLWRASAKEPFTGLSNSQLYFVFYRFVFAFAADSDQLNWAYAHGEDIAGAAVSDKGLVLVDQKGQVALLETADGRLRVGPSLGLPLEVAVVQGGLFEGGEPSTDKQPLAERLRAMALDPDSRLAEGRALAVRSLGATDSEEVTDTLVRLCVDWTLPETVRLEACQSLKDGRQKGARFVREALTQRGSFLDKKRAPPAGALALAAASMKLGGVVPELLAHLADPATPTTELPGVLAGLAVLGNAPAAERVAAFLALYHAEPKGSDLQPALAQAAAALVVLQQEKARAVLEPLTRDPFSSDELRDKLRASLSTLDKQPGPEAAAAAVAAPPTPATPAPKPIEADTRPLLLSDKHVLATLRPVMPKLKKCLGETLPSVKLVLMVDPQGALVTGASTPEGAEACLEPLLKGLRFPATQAQDPQRVVFLLRR